MTNTTYRTRPSDTPHHLVISNPPYSVQFKYLSSMNYYLRSRLQGEPEEQYGLSGSRRHNGRTYEWSTL